MSAISREPAPGRTRPGLVCDDTVVLWLAEARGQPIQIFGSLRVLVVAGIGRGHQDRSQDHCRRNRTHVMLAGTSLPDGS
jgi:hypothetical protein